MDPLRQKILIFLGVGFLMGSSLSEDLSKLPKPDSPLDHPPDYGGTLSISASAESAYLSAPPSQNAPVKPIASASLSQTTLDMFLSYTPVVSWGRDFYEAFSGKNLMTGDSLETADRSIAFWGAVSFGLGSKLSRTIFLVKRLGAVSGLTSKLFKLPIFKITTLFFGNKVGVLVKFLRNPILSLHAVYTVMWQIEYGESLHFYLATLANSL